MHGLEGKTELGTLGFDRIDEIRPYGNSVCFGRAFYSDVALW